MFLRDLFSLSLDQAGIDLYLQHYTDYGIIRRTPKVFPNPLISLLATILFIPFSLGNTPAGSKD